MCYNCGCEVPEDDMGKGNLSDGGGSLTEKDFEKMAKEWGMTVTEAKMNTLHLLKKTLGEEK